MRTVRGFTLIELMIVVAIIAILASIAIPAYQDYAIRAKLSEGITTATAVRDSVADAYATGGLNAITGVSTNYPNPNTSTGSKYVNNVSVSAAGVITITFAANAGNGIPATLNGGTITLTPQIHTAGGYQALTNMVDASIDWSCASATSATATAMGMASTPGTIPSQYVPTQCR